MLLTYNPKRLSLPRRHQEIYFIGKIDILDKISAHAEKDPRLLRALVTEWLTFVSVISPNSSRDGLRSLRGLAMTTFRVRPLPYGTHPIPYP